MDMYIPNAFDLELSLAAVTEEIMRVNELARKAESETRRDDLFERASWLRWRESELTERMRH